MRAMKSKNHQELTVEEASRALGVTPRSVINYIRAKEFEAIKVGKSWFIKRPSFDAFKQRFGFISEASLPEEAPTPHDPGVVSPVSGNHQVKPENGKKRKIYPVHALRLFQLAKEILRGMDFKTSSPELAGKLLSLKMEAIELLGAGFYAYEAKNKKALYNRSREKVGGILSLIYFNNDFEKKIPSEINRIEEDLLPAYSALIRRIEKKYEKT